MMRQSTFVFHHASHPWSNNRFLIWMVTRCDVTLNCYISSWELQTIKDHFYILCFLLQLCFLRQFRGSIRKADYFALRLGFLTVSTFPSSIN